MNDFVKKEDAIRICKMCASAKYRVPYIEQAFENISTIDAVSEWIPCSERLPSEKEGVYLICTDYGYMCSCRWTNDVYGLGANKWSAWGWCRLDVPQYSRVVAWMDLKPWKGADDE